MAHLLYRFGARALLPKNIGDKRLPPMISRDNALKLREQFYAAKQQWPYEHIVPGVPKLPPGSQQYLARQQAKQEKRAARAKEIQDALSKMPKLIGDYRESRRLDLSEVSQLDKLTLSRGQMYEKYVKRRLAKLG